MAKFSRAHYFILARALHTALPRNPQPYLAEYRAFFAEAIAAGLVNDNPRFDREHFVAMVKGEIPLDSKPTSRHKIDKRNHG